MCESSSDDAVKFSQQVECGANAIYQINMMVDKVCAKLVDSHPEMEHVLPLVRLAAVGEVRSLFVDACDGLTVEFAHQAIDSDVSVARIASLLNISLEEAHERLLI